MNGDIFYELIGGIYCSTCNQSTHTCKCPKTLAEAKQAEKIENEDSIQQLKNDKIKNIENFKKLVSNLKIMARSKPIHKYALVLGLKELNYIVAVTGDGTNDAPALSKSDVGFSMFDGTDIAKNSSDIILMDNNFSSIVTSIKYGRNIIDNLRKFIQFQLVINLTVCSFIVICSCIGSQTPITSIQMLWIDLIMDSLATLTLATEPPYDGLLKRKPTKRNENIINSKMIKHVLYQTVTQFLILMIIYLYGPKFIKEQDLSRIAENETLLKCYGVLPGGETDPKKIIYGIKTFWPNFVEINKNMVAQGLCGEYANSENLSMAYKVYYKNQGASVQLTMIFNIFVLYTLFNQLNCRVVDGNINIFTRICNNLLFVIVEISEFIIQFIIIECWNIVFKATKNGLTYYQWSMCFKFSIVTLILDLLLKVKF
jgi:Ca2+ transporting ATPase